MYTKAKIKEEIAKGHIKIDPYNEANLNPNSYNVTLSNELLIYTCGVIDMKKDNPYTIITMPEKGFEIEPGLLYLGRTVERTECHGVHVSIDGRSSVGRLGVNVHCTAGFGDNHFKGYWTFEIFCIQPVIIYPFVKISQIYFQDYCGAEGEDVYTEEEGYKGKYQDNNGVESSKMWMEFLKGVKNEH